MDFYVETPAAMHLVMRTTEDGKVALVLPAPASSLPAALKQAPEITEIQL